MSRSTVSYRPLFTASQMLGAILAAYFAFMSIVHWLAVFDLGPVPKEINAGNVGFPGFSARVGVGWIASLDTLVFLLMALGLLANRSSRGRGVIFIMPAVVIMAARAWWTVIVPVAAIVVLFAAILRYRMASPKIPDKG